MLFADHMVVLRGGGDLGTGVAWRLRRAGFPVAICELPDPLAVRRTVALSSAVRVGQIDVEGLVGVRVPSPADIPAVAAAGDVPVVVAPTLPHLGQSVVVDARLAKQPLDTTRDDAPLVVGLGPGLVAGLHCHAVVETARGHRLGRVIWNGSAEPDTGVPGPVGGRDADRVLRAPVDGQVGWERAIGDRVDEGSRLGTVGDTEIRAPIAGVVRGLIAEGIGVAAGTKIGDVDPRADPEACHQISDKALAVGGGVVEAVLTWLDSSS